MFRTNICRILVDSVWEQIFNTIQLIQKIDFNEASKELEILTEIVNNKIDAFSNGYSDEVFNEGFILKQFVKLLKDYLFYWSLLVANNFPDSWTALQDIQDGLRTIYRFINSPRPKILNHIEGQCGELEKLYPYKLFASVAIVKEEAECSICGKSIDSFECEHIAGELYRGHLAYGIVNEIKQVEEVSFVMNPADKRCTIQFMDTEQQFNGVAYLADLIRDRILAPLDFSHLEFKKIVQPNSEITAVGRNDLCPCGSGQKFKKCCISKSNIENTQVDIISHKFNVTEISL